MPDGLPMDPRIMLGPGPGVPPELLRAYLNASYTVGTGPEAAVLRIGEASEALRRLLEAAGQVCAAGLTAYNPGGAIRDSAANEAAQGRLLLSLKDGRRLRIFEGENQDPSGLWPPEPSLWVLGMGLSEGLALARSCGQNALVWVGSDAVPRLAFCG